MTEQLRCLDLTDLLGLGLSPKTAYTYSRPEITAGYTRTTGARLRAVVAMIDYGRESVA